MTIAVSSSNPGEATVSPASLVFTTANWSVAETVTATGVDDDADDGDVGYSVVLGAAVSTNPEAYAGFDPADVAGSTTDDDTAGCWSPRPRPGPPRPAGSPVVLLALLAEPASSGVVIGVTSADSGEGTVSPPSLSFTAANWSVDQPVTLTGVDDAVADGDVAWSVTFAMSTLDPAYAAIAIPSVEHGERGRRRRRNGIRWSDSRPTSPVSRTTSRWCWNPNRPPTSWSRSRSTSRSRSRSRARSRSPRPTGTSRSS